MRRPLGILVSLFIVSVGSISAQTPSIMSAGYGPPAMIQAAPGQIITVYVSGTKSILPAGIRATTIPLPSSLGGFSVTVRQGASTYAAPMVSVTQTPNCIDANPSPQCIITALTVQIPFEIATVPFLQASAQVPTDLTVNDNGTESAHISIAPLMDRIHILTVCDKAGITLSTPSPCNAIVTHADGTTGSSAKPGETIVMYAYGLGQTTPPVKTGDITPAPGTVLLDAPNFTVQFDFRPNAGPAMPYIAPTSVLSPAPITGPVISLSPIFVGLTAGQVGLYQINVKIPDTVPSLPACSEVFSCPNPNRCIVQSNLTIDIGGFSSFDGAAICVQPPQ